MHCVFFFFFFNDTATTEIYTLSLHDLFRSRARGGCRGRCRRRRRGAGGRGPRRRRSEEHTSELQSPCNLVCRLLLEKKKKLKYILFNNSKYYLVILIHISGYPLRSSRCYIY